MNPREEIRNELAEMAPVLHGLDPQMPFTLREGYFEGLEADIKARISASAFPATMPYEVPAGYFESLKFTVPREAKVIPMRPKTSVFRYAAAAVITGLLGLSLFNVMSSNKQSGTSGETQFAFVDKPVTESLGTADLDQALSNLSDADITTYLASSGVDVQTALVAAAQQNGTNLPEAADYIIDETALESFLTRENLMN